MKHILLFLFTFFILLSQIDFSDNGVNTKRYKEIGNSGSAPAAGELGSLVNSFRVDQSTGQLVGNLPLFNVAKFNFSLSYNSLVHEYFEKPNFMAPNTESGVGFSLNKMQIIAEHKNTTTYVDDDFYIIMPDGAKYEIKERSNGTYYTIPYSNLKISKNLMTGSVSGDEIIINWEIIDESGTKYKFGDDTFNTSSFSGLNATRFLRSWHGIITNGWENSNAEYVPYAWDLAKIYDRFNKQIASLTYQQVHGNVGRYSKGDASNKYTLSSHLIEIKDFVNGLTCQIDYDNFPDNNLFFEKKIPRGTYSFYNTKFLKKLSYYRHNIKYDEIEFIYSDINGVNSTQKRKLLDKVKKITDRPYKTELVFNYILTDPDLTNKHSDNYGRLKSLDNGVKKITYNYSEQSLTDSEISHGFSDVGLYGSSSVVGNGYYIAMTGSRYNNAGKYIFYYDDGSWKKKNIGSYNRNIAIHPTEKKFLIVNRTGINTRTIDEWYFENKEWKKRKVTDLSGIEGDNSLYQYFVKITYNSNIAAVLWNQDVGWQWHMKLYELKNSSWTEIQSKNNLGETNYPEVFHFNRYVLISGRGSKGDMLSYLYLKNNQGNWVGGLISLISYQNGTLYYKPSKHFANENFILKTPFVSKYAINDMSFYRIDYSETSSSNILAYLKSTGDYTSNGYGKDNRIASLKDNYFIYQNLFEFNGNNWIINPDATFAFNNNKNYVSAQMLNNNIFIKDQNHQTTIIRYENDSLNQMFVNLKAIPDTHIPNSTNLSTAFGKIESFRPGSGAKRNFYFDIFDKYPKLYEITTLHGDNFNNYSNDAGKIYGNGLINVISEKENATNFNGMVQLIWPNYKNYNINISNFTDKYYVRNHKYSNSGSDYFFNSFSFYGNTLNANRNLAPYTLFINNYRNSLSNVNITATSNSTEAYHVVRSIEIEDKLTIAKTTKYYNYTGGKLDNNMNFARFSQVESYTKDKSQGYYINNFVYGPMGGNGDFTNSNEYLLGKVKSNISYDGNGAKVSEVIYNYFVDKKESDSYKVQLKSVIKRDYPKSGVNDYIESESTNTFNEYDLVTENVTHKRIVSGGIVKSTNKIKTVTSYSITDATQSLKSYLRDKNLVTAVNSVRKYNNDDTTIAYELQKYHEHNSHYLPVSKLIWIDRNENKIMDESESDFMKSDSILSFNSYFLPVSKINLNSSSYEYFVYHNSYQNKVLAKVNNSKTNESFFYSMGDLTDNGNSLPYGISEYVNHAGNTIIKSISDFTVSSNGHSLKVNTDISTTMQVRGVRVDQGLKSLLEKSDYIVEYDLYIESGKVKVYGSGNIGDLTNENITNKWLHKRHIIRKTSYFTDMYLYFVNQVVGENAIFYIDNIRVYPKNATMESYVYNYETKKQTAIIETNGKIQANSLDFKNNVIQNINEKNQPASSSVTFNGIYSEGSLTSHQKIETTGLEPGYHENFNNKKAEKFQVFINSNQVQLDYSNKYLNFNTTNINPVTYNTNTGTLNNPQNASATITNIGIPGSYLSPVLKKIYITANADIYNYRMNGTIYVDAKNSSGSVIETKSYPIGFYHNSSGPDIMPGPGSDDIVDPVNENKTITYIVPAGAVSAVVRWTLTTAESLNPPNTTVITNSFINARGEYQYTPTVSKKIIVYNQDISNKRISLEYDIRFSDNIESGAFYYRGAEIEINPKQIKYSGSGTSYFQNKLVVNKWHKIKLAIEPNQTNNTAKVYLWVNGDNVFTTAGLYETISVDPTKNNLGFVSQTFTGTTDIDNFTVFNEPVYTTSFFDGYGNVLQSQSWNGENNIVSAITYDSYHRVMRSYQAFPSSSGPFLYITDFDMKAKAYRGNNQYPYVEYEYYKKPGAVIKRQSELSHHISNRNIQSKEAVLVNSNSVPTELTNLLTSSYWKYESIDADAVRTIEYQDVFAHVVATEVQSSKVGSQEKKFTAIEYDEFGRISKSYLPMSNFSASSPTFVDSYTYNEFNKVKSSTMVNENTVKQVFDRLGRLRAKKLANYDGTNGYYWEVYEYDKFDRLLFSGLLTSNFSMNQMKTFINSRPLSRVQEAINGSDPTSNYKDFLQVITYNQSESPFSQPIYNDKVHVFNSSHSANDLTFNPGFETGPGVEMIAGHNVLNEVPSALKIKSIYFYDDYNFDLSTNSSQDLTGLSQENEINAMGQVTREIAYLNDSEYMIESFIYDEYGEVIEKRVNLPGLNEKKILYKYNEENRALVQVDYNSSGDGSDRIVMDYNYNRFGQIVKVESSDDGVNNKRVEVTNTYDHFGRELTINPNNTGNHSLYYKYDHLDRLKEINNFSLATSSVFSENIVYRADGLIDYAEYQNKHFTGSGSGNSPIYKYSYSYNNFNELKAADYQYKASFAANYTNPTDFNTSYNFDKNGNMLSLNRRYASLADNWTYSYYSNTDKLKSLGGPDFTYDASGLLKYDPTRSVNLSYDHKNRLKSASGTAVNDQYFYDNQTRRVKTVNSITGTTTYYVYGLSANALAVYEGSNIKEWALGTFGTKHKTSSGRKSTYHFKDHKGNIRVSIDETGQTISARDYFPFGKVLRSYELAGNGKQRYKYSGKELDASTNYSYYGFRYYNADIARWMNPDPLHQGFSPYLFNGNTPHITVDTDGRAWWVIPAMIAFTKSFIAGRNAWSENESMGDFFTAFGRQLFSPETALSFTSAGIGSAIGEAVAGSSYFVKLGVNAGLNLTFNGFSNSISGNEFFDGWEYTSLQSIVSTTLDYISKKMVEKRKEEVEELAVIKIKEAGEDPNEKLDPTNENLKEFADTHFSDFQKRSNNPQLSVEENMRYLNSDKQIMTVHGPAYGVTEATARYVNHNSGMITEDSKIRIAPAAFRSRKKLYLVLGHEYIHSIQFANGLPFLLNKYYSFSRKEALIYMEWAAHTWSATTAMQHDWMSEFRYFSNLAYRYRFKLGDNNLKKLGY